MDRWRGRALLVAGVAVVAIAALATLPVGPVRAPAGAAAIDGLVEAGFAIVATLALLRHRVTGDSGPLLVGTGAGIIAVQTLVWGAYWIASRASATTWESNALPAFAESFGWLVAGACFLMAKPWWDRRGRKPIRALPVFAIAFGALVAGDGLLVLVRGGLSNLSTSGLLARSAFGHSFAGLWILSVAAFALLFGAGVRELRASDTLRGPHAWLGAGWVLAALAQVVLLARPIAFRPIVIPADALPVLVAALALIGFLVQQGSEVMWMRRATDRADEIMGGRAEIATMAAHELRGPVTTIRGLAATARTHYDRLDDDERREFLGMIELESRRLLDTVNQVANALKIDAGTLTYEMKPQDVTAVVNQATDAAETGEHPLEIDADDTTATIVGDRRWLAEAVRQLVDNAARFSPSTAPIAIEIVSGVDVVIGVVDRGPGIPRAHRDRVFDKFASWRPEGYEEAAGSGLGLFISRGIARAHGGDVTIEDGPEGGTMVRLRIPVEA